MLKINPDFGPLHQPVRFAGVAYIYLRGGQSTFAATYKAIGKSPSLWASHVNVLERAGLLKTRKSFVGKRLRSEQTLTQTGLKAFECYIGALLAIASGSSPRRR